MQAVKVSVAHLRAARAVPKSVYLLQTQSQRMLKRTAAECVRMTGNNGGGIGRLSATVDNADGESARGEGSGGAGCCFGGVHSPTANPVGSHCVEPNPGGTTWVDGGGRSTGRREGNIDDAGRGLSHGAGTVGACCFKRRCTHRPCQVAWYH